MIDVVLTNPHPVHVLHCDLILVWSLTVGNITIDWLGSSLIGPIVCGETMEGVTMETMEGETMETMDGVTIVGCN
jgi:hypothetical protein